MDKFIYKTDFNDLSKDLKTQLIKTIIEKKLYRGDYAYLENNEFTPIKNLKDVLNNLHLQEEIENELNSIGLPDTNELSMYVIVNY